MVSRTCLPATRLTAILARSNRPINAIEIRKIARTLFGHNLTLEQAGNHLAEIDARLRSLYATTIRFLDTGKVRRGDLEEALRFCRDHQMWDIQTLNANEIARREYIEALEFQFPRQGILDLLKSLQTTVGDKLGRSIEAMAKEEILDTTLRRRIIKIILDALQEKLTVRPDIMGEASPFRPMPILETISNEQRKIKKITDKRIHNEIDDYIKQMQRLLKFFRRHLIAGDLDLLAEAINRWDITTKQTTLNIMLSVLRALPRGFFFASAQEHREEYFHFLKALEAKSDKDMLGVPRKMWVFHNLLSKYVNAKTFPLGIKSKERLEKALIMAFSGEKSIFYPERPSLLDAIPPSDLSRENTYKGETNREETFTSLFKIIYEKGYSMNIPIIGDPADKELREPLSEAIASVLIDKYFKTSGGREVS